VILPEGISKMLYRHFVAGLFALMAASLGPGASDAWAQSGDRTVTIEKPDIQVRSRPSLKSDIVSPAPAGTVLAVMDREESWLWVLLPPDTNGTRHPGWIRSSDLGAPGDEPPAPDPKAEKEAKKKAAEEDRQLQKQQAQENEHLKQEQAKAAQQAKREAEADRKLKEQQAAEERRLEEQQAQADRKAKQQQAEEDRRLERAKRELDKAKQEFEKVAKTETPEPAK
jgi:uncharacterized protein YgiM (DUF1202 family)